ncbi:MAG TPA: thioredoxin domain-containing protein [Caulobacter sp.]|nr:thioredoxin domain-containing protein [Caulobacter sp.]
MGLFNRRAMIGATIAISALALAACGKKGAASAEGDMSLGDPNAKVKMVEYGSLSCVHCANWNKDVFPAFKKKYIDTGKIHYTFRPFKLGAGDSYTAAGDLLGRCVGKDKYFTVIDALFHAQEEALTGSPLEVLVNVGGQAGLSEAEVKACITNEKALVALDDRLKTGLAKEVQATPTFWIGDQKFETSLPLAEIDKAYAAAAK